MIKGIIILIGTVLLLIEQIKNFKKERTTSTIFCLIVSVVMLISAIMIFIGALA